MDTSKAHNQMSHSPSFGDCFAKDHAVVNAISREVFYEMLPMRDFMIIVNG